MSSLPFDPSVPQPRHPEDIARPLGAADPPGKDIKQIEEDSERDRYFSAAEAKEYGLVDEVLGQPAATEESKPQS